MPDAHPVVQWLMWPSGKKAWRSYETKRVNSHLYFHTFKHMCLPCTFIHISQLLP